MPEIPEQTPETTIEITQPGIITPVAVVSTDSPKTKQPEIEVPAGHVLLVALNADGTEKEGSEFFYPEKSYARFYSDTSKFRIKKKAN